MKQPKFKSLFFIIISSVFLFDCQSQIISPIEKENEPTKSINVPTTIFSTLSPTEINYFTPTNVVTETLSVEPTKNPTLSSNDMEQKIINLLQTNGYCVFPCVWGFTPGKTYGNQVTDYFSNIGWGIKPYPILNGNVFYTGKDISEALSVRFAYHISNEFVEGISLAYNHPEFGDRDQIMAISNIFQLYGEPDQSWLSLNLGGEVSVEIIEQAGFDFYLFYKDPLFLTIYSGLAVHNNDKFSFCLVSENQQSAADQTYINSLTIYTGSENIKNSPNGIIEPFGRFNGQKEIDEAINMTSNELYRWIYLEQKTPCFTTLDNIWQN